MSCGRLQAGQSSLAHQLTAEVTQQYTIERNEQPQAYQQLEYIVHGRDLDPVFSHEGVRAAPEGDAEESDSIHQITKQGGGSRRNPPVLEQPQPVEHHHVHELPHQIGHKAGQGDACHKQVELGQMADPLEAPFKEEHREHIGDSQSGQHHGLDDLARQAGTEDPHRQIGSQKDKREAERTPGSVKAEDGDRQLNQIVAAGNDQDVEQRETHQRRLVLSRGQIHIVTFLVNGVREPIPPPWR